MSIDMGALLDRVVADVFDDQYLVESQARDEYPWRHAYLISRSDGQTRSFRVLATYEWCDVWIPELDVGTIMFDYDDDPSEKELIVRWLCVGLRHYLDGVGQITQRKTLIRRKQENVLRFEVDGAEWVLGRHFSSPPVPW